MATQYRPDLPDWGLLLDHLGHSIDTILWISKEQSFMIDNCTHEIADGVYEKIVVNGRMNNGTPVYIFDEVMFQDKNRQRTVKLVTPLGAMDITSNFQMFIKMWEYFFENYRLGLPQYPGIKDAFNTQRILQECFEKCVQIEVGLLPISS